jgi:chromate transporter
VGSPGEVFGRIGSAHTAHAALSGINAAVVGLLAAALYNPVWTSAVHSAVDVATVIVAFLLLQRCTIPPVLIAALCVSASLATALIR